MTSRSALAIPVLLLVLGGCSDDDPAGPGSSSTGASGPGGAVEAMPDRLEQ